MFCIKCGCENREGELICQNCGTLCETSPNPHHKGGVATRVLVKDATIPVTDTILMVSFVVAGINYDYPVKNGDSILLGRELAGQMTDVAMLDLAQAGGADKGISRQHAVIKIEGHQILLSDLGSTNGTFINGRRLAPNILYPFDPAENLRLGAMAINLKIP